MSYPSLPDPHPMKPGWFEAFVNPWDNPRFISAIDRSRSTLPAAKPEARRAEDQEAVR